MASELLTFDEARKYLKVSKSTLYSWIRQKKIPACKIGRFWRFKESRIDSWLDKHSEER